MEFDPVLIQSVLAVEKAAFSQEDSWNQSQIQGELEAEDSLILAISPDGSVFDTEPYRLKSGLPAAAGYIAARILLPDNTIDILRVAVLPDFQCRGFGKKLLESVESEGSVFMDFPVFCLLEVSSRNESALHLYKKQGYETLHIRKKYYKDGSDALIMRKTLLK